MKKIFSWILILIGIGVLTYPTIESQYYSYQQDKLISSWEESMMIVDSIDTNTEISVDLENSINDDGTLSNDVKLSASVFIPIDMEISSEKEEAARIEQERIAKEEEKRQAEYIQDNMEGILVIDAINFKQPIIRDASAKNMLLTVTSFKDTGLPGEIGNYAIIGHRNLTYGRNFNRLGEVELNDTIKVITDTGTFIYTVTDIFLVLPDDVGVLFGTNLEKRITLITCDPVGHPTHRLIVIGKILD
ncbi:MAG: class D sortase [Clostridiales bacterium]|nr:class D sortase [Clostridiales bacterium]